MGKTAILAVRIIGDAVRAVQAMRDTEAGAYAMEKAFNVARAAAALVFAAILAGGIQVSQVASDLQQASGAVDAVFQSQAAGIHEAAASAAQDVGLARDQYSQLASVLGSQLRNLGVAQDALGGQTGDLIALGADLSAMYGGTAADAVGALSSLLRGERDPIERYGVSIKQADINARLAAMGLSDLTGEAAKNAELQATLALLMEQTAAAQGTFARESDTASGAQQRANAAWRDAQAQLGEALLPYIVQAAGAMSEFASWVEQNHQLVQVLVVILALMAVAVIALTAAQWAFNIAALANPVGLVVLAIVLAIGILIAAVLLVIKYWGEIERFGQEAFANVSNFIGGVAFELQNLANDIIDVINLFIRLSTGQDLANNVADMFGFDKVNFAPQLAKLDVVQRTPTQAPVQQVTNVTVNGAIDTNGVANQIKGILAANGRTVGSVPAGGTA